MIIICINALQKGTIENTDRGRQTRRAELAIGLHRAGHGARQSVKDCPQMGRTSE